MGSIYIQQERLVLLNSNVNAILIFFIPKQNNGNMYIEYFLCYRIRAKC